MRARKIWRGVGGLMRMRVELVKRRATAGGECGNGGLSDVMSRLRRARGGEYYLWVGLGIELRGERVGPEEVCTKATMMSFLARVEIEGRIRGAGAGLAPVSDRQLPCRQAPLPSRGKTRVVCFF